MLVVPRFGELTGILAEVPIMLLAAYVICRWVLEHWQVSPSKQIRWTMVLLFLLLLFAFENVARPGTFWTDAIGTIGSLGNTFRGAWHFRSSDRGTPSGVPQKRQNALMGITRRQWLFGLGGLALFGTVYTRSRFMRALEAAEQRISGRSQIIDTAFGTLEYAVSGSGSPLLMIHGTGGGFDQGLSFASGLLKLGHQIVSPSRFGYLRSDFPADPSLANQGRCLCGAARSSPYRETTRDGWFSGRPICKQFSRCAIQIVVRN